MVLKSWQYAQISDLLNSDLLIVLPYLCYSTASLTVSFGCLVSILNLTWPDNVSFICASIGFSLCHLHFSEYHHHPFQWTELKLRNCLRILTIFFSQYQIIGNFVNSVPRAFFSLSRWLPVHYLHLLPQSLWCFLTDPALSILLSHSGERAGMIFKWLD